MADDRTAGRGNRSAQRRARYREIASVLWEERLLSLFRGVGLEEELPAGMAGEAFAGTREKDLPKVVRVRRALERLGPMFVKLGQLLVTRGHLLPPALVQELAKLQDEAPTVPWPEIRARIEAELGAPVEEVFGSFDEEPLAAASIGQVYRATLLDGTPVAVKVQRPGVTEAMEVDLHIVQDLADRLTRHVRWARENDVATIAEGLAAILRAELDYLREGRSLDRFRSIFEADPSLVFPRVYWDQTTSRVLTMDLLEGVPCTNLGNGEVEAAVDREHLVRIGVEAYLRMIFQVGFYHADPHAGNLFALPGGRLGFVDFGRVATVSERNRDAVFDMFLALSEDDSAGVTEGLLAATGVSRNVDLAALEIDVGALLVRYRRYLSDGLGLDRTMRDLLRLMRDHQLRASSELTMLFVTLGILEGVAIQIDPSFRMVDAAQPFARRLVPERYSPDRLLRASLRATRAYGRLFDQLPVHAVRALRRAGQGEFEIAVRPARYDAFVDRLVGGFYVLAYALLIGALIIGLAFLSGREGLTRPERITYGVVLHAAMASALWLLIRVVVNGWRRRRADKRRRRVGRP